MPTLVAMSVLSKLPLEQPSMEDGIFPQEFSDLRPNVQTSFLQADHLLFGREVSHASSRHGGSWLGSSCLPFKMI